MASSSPITYISSSPPIINKEPPYGGFPLPPSIRLSKRSPKRHARYTNSDILLLDEARDFLKVTSYTDIWGNWQYGGRRIRTQTHIDQASQKTCHSDVPYAITSTISADCHSRNLHRLRGQRKIRRQSPSFCAR